MWLGTQWLHAAQFSSLVEASVGLLGHGCFACNGGRTLETCTGERNISLAAFSPTTSAVTRPLSAQLHCRGMKKPPSPQLRPPAPFHSTTFSLLHLIRSQENGFSLLPLFCLPFHSYCMLAVRRASLYKKTPAQSTKEGVFQETRTKNSGSSRMINSHFTYATSS